MQNITFEIVKKINSSGINDCLIEIIESLGNEKSTTLHWHHAFELTLVLEGATHYIAEGEHHYVSAGDLLFINSGFIHQTENISNTEINRSLVMVISDTVLEGLDHSVAHSYFCIEKNSPERNEIISAMYKIANYLENLQPFEHLLIRSEFLKILYILYSKCREEKKTLIIKNTSFKNIIKYVGEHYSEKISLKDISSIAGLHENYFCRYFKNETGISFHQYLSRIRLNSALALLTSGPYSALDCALQSGFSSEKVFIDWCKKVYNCTPLQYKSRRKNLNNSNLILFK